MSYRLYKARAESYLPTASIRTSLISQSETLGYSVYRGYPPRIRVTFSPLSTMSISKFEVVGDYEGYDLVAVESGIYVAGDTYTVDFGIGKLVTKTVDISSPDPQLFRIVGENISEMTMLKLNSAEVRTSSQYKDLLDGKWLVITSPYGVDITHLNGTGQNDYSAGDVLEFLYVELIDDIDNFDTSKVYFTTISGITSVSYIPRIDPESNESIRINAPVYHETQGIVRARGDFKKIVKMIRPDFLDVNQNDPTPINVEVTYLTSDQSLLSATEKSDLVRELAKRMPFGFPDPTVVDPVSVSLDLTITLDVFADSNVASSQINNDVKLILDEYEKKFGVTVDLDLITKRLYELWYVKTASVVVNLGGTSLNWNEYIWEITYSLVINLV